MEFVSPPPAKGAARSAHWVNVVTLLKEHAAGCGEKGCEHWGKVGNYSPGVATHIRNGEYPAFIPEGTVDGRKYMRSHWQIRSAKTGPGRNDLYIRWIG